ncbi:MAG: ATP-binding protein [bacterium]
MKINNLEQLLVQQNPHWTIAPTLFGHQRDLFETFFQELTKPKLIIAISGARRSGKTFMLKQSINQLIQNEHVPANNICYFQFATSLNEKNIIQTIIDIFLQKYSTPGEKYIFLDEVQYIDYWQDQLKSVYDLNLGIKFVVSGSTSLFYHQKSKESLAGRLYKLSLGVLSFGEYCRFRGIPEPSTNRATFVSNLSIYQTEFRTYLSSGQYPELAENKDIDAFQYITDLADQLINFDIPYLSSKIDRTSFLNLVKTLSFDLAGEYSASSLAKNLEIDRREVTEYIKILEEINLFKPIYNYALKSMRKKLAGTKKIYSLNLNLSLHLNSFDTSYLNDTRVYGRYFENYICIRLLSKYQQLEYYRNNGKELDFVTGELAYEIKSNPSVSISKHQELSLILKKKLTVISQEEAYII